VSESSATPSETGRRDRHRILLVEDARELGEALSQQFEVLGYECAMARTCDAARQHLNRTTYAAALIDLGLPDGRGLDLLGDLTKIAPQTVPIILTGDAASETIIHAMRMGAFDYLLKPIDLMTLRTSVGRAIVHHEAIRDRAILVELLKTERDRLRERIEEATADIRKQARRLETNNVMLTALLDVSQLASRFMTDEGLLRAVYETLEKHVPLKAFVLGDVGALEFIGVTRREGTIHVVTTKGMSPSPADGKGGAAEPYVVQGLRQNMSLDPAAWHAVIVEPEFWGRPVCSVAFFLGTEVRPDDAEREFLKMCGQFVAFEWQRSRLLLHGAQQAGLGNIAQELARTFLHSLTAVRTTADVLLESADSDDTREGLQIIGRQAEYLAEQAQSFYKLAQMRSDSVETVRLSDYIDQTLNLLTRAIEQRGVSIEKEFTESGECILLNGGALASAFLDLISTAIRYVRGDASLRIRLLAQGQDHILCEIVHIDSGTDAMRGPRQDALADVVRAHPRYLLAQRTVRTCGGSLTVERQGERRSAFKMILPRNGLDVQAN
jgi:DNA-binding response OmpR family regulator